MEDRSWLWQVEVALKDAERSENALAPGSLGGHQMEHNNRAIRHKQSRALTGRLINHQCVRDHMSLSTSSCIRIEWIGSAGFAVGVTVRVLA
jgi:hypothetical protein